MTKQSYLINSAAILSSLQKAQQSFLLFISDLVKVYLFTVYLTSISLKMYLKKNY